MGRVLFCTCGRCGASFAVLDGAPTDVCYVCRRRAAVAASYVRAVRSREDAFASPGGAVALASIDSTRWPR